MAASFASRNSIGIQTSRNSDGNLRCPIFLGSHKASFMLASSSGRNISIPCSRRISRTTTCAVASSQTGSVSSAVPIGALQPTLMLMTAIVKFVVAVWVKAQNTVVAVFPQVQDIKAEVRQDTHNSPCIILTLVYLLSCMRAGCEASVEAAPH